MSLLLKKKESIQNSMKIFTETIKSYIENSGNFLIRSLLGIHSAAIIRTILSLESNPKTIPYIQNLRNATAELVVTFYPIHLKHSLQLFSFINSLVDDLPEENKQTFLNILQILTPEIRNIYSIFSTLQILVHQI
jgi:hypothetical protein